MIGDAIIDEYVYIKALGKSPKENIIANRILRSESFKGGVFAAARHLETFCAQVDVSVGDACTYKRRFVENTYLRKLFEVHEERNEYHRAPVSYEDYDLVIVTDFGHGAILDEMLPNIELRSKFLAVNAQTNSANHGFNLITKYTKADYVVLDELEARLAARDRDSKIEKVIEKLNFPKIIVTLGPEGAIGYDGDFYKEQGTKDKVIDTMGAGDAFFCVTAPFAACGADMPTLLKIGNAAGAMKCGTVGHRESVTKNALLKKLVDNVN